MTKDFLYPKTFAPKALIIGHDPRLQNSDTIADYALFADYYFEPKEEMNGAQQKKLGLATAAFEQIEYLTYKKIQAKDIYVTNLCNNPLEHVEKGKTVYIPREMAEEGVYRIQNILSKYQSIKYIFPMSCQVNYCLAYLGLFDAPKMFLKKARPIERGVNANPRYYMQSKTHAFSEICGNIYRYNWGDQSVIPTLHCKNFPLRGVMKAYFTDYERIRQYFHEL